MRRLIKIGLVALIVACSFLFSTVFAVGYEYGQTKSDTLRFKSFSGKVIDKETKKPIVFANVYVDGSGLGTVTNSEGEFVIKIPAEKYNAKLGVTFLGYSNIILSIEELNSEGNIIALQPSPIPIDEVIVRSGNALELVEGALKNIRDNYQSTPEKQVGFYRETIKQNRYYIEVAEAVLDVYKASYTDDFDFDRVKIYKGRKSQDVKKMDTILFKFQGGPKTSFLLDVIKTPGNILSNDMLEFYDFNLAGMTKINDRNSYIIDFDQKDGVNYPLYQGKIYLDVQTLAVAGIDFRISEKGIKLAGNELIRKKPVSMKMDVESGYYLVNYRELNGKWYLNHVRSELIFKCKWDKEFFRSEYITTFEMAVTDRDTSNVNKFKFKEIAKISDVFADQVNYFADEEFWGEYNFIKPDESIQYAIARLNKKLKLRE